MHDFTVAKASLGLLALLLLGTVVFAQQRPMVQTGGGIAVEPAADARHIAFTSNLIPDPCATCDYSDDGGYALLGPDNCYLPGTTQWLGGTFIASATGLADRISAAIISKNLQACPENKMTLSIYTDACYPTGPGTRLASATATVPKAPCDMAVAKLRRPLMLTKGEKYWVTATTSRGQSALASNWYASNNAQVAYNTGDGNGWYHFTLGTPAFTVEGSGRVFSNMIPDAAHQPFGGNLFVDPCTGCNYDLNAGNFEVRGSDNCTDPGVINWVAVPFVAAKSGVPKRISAPIILKNLAGCSENNVTLSLYTDDCDIGPATPLVSAVATVPTAPCELAVATLRNAPKLQKSAKYWVVATTTDIQAGLDANWYAANTAQDAFDFGFGGWMQHNASTPAFLVQ